MAIKGIKNNNENLDYVNINTSGTEYWNLTSEELEAKTIELGMGELSDSGAISLPTVCTVPLTLFLASRSRFGVTAASNGVVQLSDLSGRSPTPSNKT